MSTKQKALVVDDTAFHSNFLKMFLGMKHYDVTVATDGVEGLAACKQEAYDIVFSDIEMPNMNGIELLRSIKRLSAYASTPVILISTLDDEAMKQKAASLGAFSSIVKPFNTKKMDDLFAKLNG
jgi:two-component system chemotaxis response regulator CheY